MASSRQSPVAKRQPRCQPVSSLRSSPAPWGGRLLRADRVSELSTRSWWPSWERVTGASSEHGGLGLESLELQEVGEEGGAGGLGWWLSSGPGATRA